MALKLAHRRPGLAVAARIGSSILEQEMTVQLPPRRIGGLAEICLKEATSARDKLRRDMQRLTLQSAMLHHRK